MDSSINATGARGGPEEWPDGIPGAGLGPLIPVFLSTVQKARRGKLAGIYSYGQARRWRIQVMEDHPFAPRLPDPLDGWQPSGIIMDGDGPLAKIPRRLLGRLPVVFLDKPPRKTGRRFFCVNHDSAQTARAAARELLRLRLDSYGYVGAIPGIYWSRERELAFADEIRGRGLPCAVYRCPGRGADCRRDQSSLQRWLRALPKPCGIFAAMDLRAKQVEEACLLARLRIPEDIAILGVDNDAPLCESLSPSLSSILPDFEEGGRLAAELLDDRLRNPAMDPETRAYGPLRVFRRQSTRRFATKHLGVSAAVEYIRLNACLGIGVPDVAASMKVSRRMAESLFRRVAGHSMLDEIQSVRLERVCALLRYTRVPIGMIAGECGYASDVHLKILFKKRMGLSMREWRARNAEPHPRFALDVRGP